MNEHVEACSTPPAQSPAPLSDCTPEQLASGRYLDALDELVDAAAAGKHMRILADAIAWTFARVAIGCGPAATGDMLSLVGNYMVKLETHNQAERELERERQAGRLPN
jgi:hypothetical protein